VLGQGPGSRKKERRSPTTNRKNKKKKHPNHKNHKHPTPNTKKTPPAKKPTKPAWGKLKRVGSGGREAFGRGVLIWTEGFNLNGR